MLSALLLVGPAQSAQTVPVWQINTVDSGGSDSSLVLDAAGYPVISYYDGANENLKLAHCNDANCSGNNESIQTVDSVGSVGAHLSLVLDAAGYPVISYFDLTNEDLKLAHCNDANCSGNDESIQTVDSFATAGWFTSLAPDAAGYPVISHLEHTDRNLKLVYGISLVLDAVGYPVISYSDDGDVNGDLKLVHCNDANCSGNDESMQMIDSAGNVGGYSSLVLDAAGYAVISYFDETNNGLKLARQVGASETYFLPLAHR